MLCSSRAVRFSHLWLHQWRRAGNEAGSLLCAPPLPYSPSPENTDLLERRREGSSGKVRAQSLCYPTLLWRWWTLGDAMVNLLRHAGEDGRFFRLNLVNCLSWQSLGVLLWSAAFCDPNCHSDCSSWDDQAWWIDPISQETSQWIDFREGHCLQE